MSALPEIGKLTAAPTERLRGLGHFFQEVGLSLEALHPVVAAASRLPAILRGPMRAFHLRQRKDRAALAMRMFAFSDPVSEQEAKEAAGDRLGELHELGLLVRRPEGVVSPLVLSLVDDLFIFSDDLRLGGDAVMGLGETTTNLTRAAMPIGKVESVLDLGAGSGTCGLVLSRKAKRVVATDINPRAVQLTRINAAINGITNLEAREGSLFEPVANERFSLIVSQPPFVPKPENVPGASFQFGGARGDEIALQLFAGLKDHLAPSGRAVVLVDFPAVEGKTPCERVDASLAMPSASMLVLQSPIISADEQATHYAAASHPTLGADFEREALARREHLDQLGIRGVFPTLVIVTLGQASSFSSTVATLPFSHLEITGGRIEKLLLARAIAHDQQKLLRARLRVPNGTVFTQQQVGPGEDVPSSLGARFAPDALVGGIELTPELLLTLTLIHEASSVEVGLGKLAAAKEVPVAEALTNALPAVREALLYGLLEVQFKLR